MRKSRWPWLIASLAGCLVLSGTCAAPARRDDSSAGARSLDPLFLARAEAAIEHSIAAGEIPGAVLLIGDADGILYRRALGDRAIHPVRERMSEDTLFDLASLTKPVATATSIMKLIDQGKLRPGDRVAAYIPEFGAAGKEAITVEQLLTHRSGLIADNPLSDYGVASEALRRICDLSPQSPPGTRTTYSDVGYIVLGEIVRRITGRPLDQFAAQEIFAPLGMKNTAFNPPADWAGRIAPTEPGLRGRVHDPRAAALGGVAGHAGLFSTADDLALYCRTILRNGEGILSSSAVAMMTEPRGRAGDCRSYGFDVDTPFSSCRGLRFPTGRSFGHTGFTGTMFWIDPVNDLYVILLTSRLQMPGGGANRAVRAAVATFVAEAALGVDRQRVLTGVDVAVHDQFKSLAGRRVGLITNHTGQDRFGRRTVDLLHHAPGVRLVTVFSPEHGIAGKLDEEGIAHSRDEKTGLPVYSLYGDTRRPTPQMLAGIDTLVFDIQDIGTRFYTYITTMGYAMEEAARHGMRFIVLDRPNPIFPLGALGPLADQDKLSFVAYKPLPIVHGMTMGELAQLFKGEYLPTLDLHVIGMKHYHRRLWWDQTGVEWINPSPNMRSPKQALLYPGIGLLEMTNLSVGRGTDKPFEQVGAPWIDAGELAAAMASARLPGIRFEPISFTPRSSKFEGQLCHGLGIAVTDRSGVEPIRVGLTLAWHLRRLYGDRFDHARLQTLLVSEQTYRTWMATSDPARIDLNAPESFLRIRSKYLIYQ